MSSPSGGGCVYWTKVIICVIGIVFSFFMFFIMVFAFGNYNAGIWAVVSGVVVSLSLHLHMVYKYSSLDAFYTEGRLKVMVWIALGGAAISVVVFAGYLTYAEIHNIPMRPFGSSFIVSAIQALLAGKSFLLFAFQAVRYRKYMLENPRFLDQEELDPDHYVRQDATTSPSGQQQVANA